MNLPLFAECLLLPPPSFSLSLPLPPSPTTTSSRPLLKSSRRAVRSLPQPHTATLSHSLVLLQGNFSLLQQQEGRMRGQAFLTFPSIDLAQCALNLVNGYLFKGKPMIIQFGRNPAGKPK